MGSSVLASLANWRRSVNWYIIFLSCILIASGIVRLYGFNRILGDWHSFRQVDTASVTREYVKNGIQPLYPKYHDVSNIASGFFNPEGWRMVEFPLLNVLGASILQANPSLELVQTHRMISIISSLITLLCIAWLMQHWYSRAASLVAAAIFGFMPFSIFFSRVILPEPFMVMWGMVGLVFVHIWAEKTAGLYDAKRSGRVFVVDGWLLVAASSFAISLLVKPVALFFAPLYFLALWRWRRPSTLAISKVVVLFAASVVPLVMWREWIQQFPEGIPASDWLLNGNDIRFRPAWWRWLFADRLGRMMFGNWGVATLVLGAVAAVWNFPAVKKSKQSWLAWIIQEIDALGQREGLVLGSILCILGFFIVFATGNVQHDYYQTLVIPAVAIVSARGVMWLLTQARTWWQLVWMSTATLILFVFSFGFAWYDIEALFSVRNPALVPAGEAAQRLTPPDSLIIAHYSGDTTLLFAAERRGWSIGYSLEEKRAQGAEFFLSTAKDDATEEALEKYAIMEETDLYILIDLRTPRATGSAEEN